MRRLCSASLLVLLSAVGAHASTVSSVGTITFHGAIRQYTMPLSESRMGDHPALGATTSIVSVSKARTVLSSDLLDYFASYAKPEAKLVTTAYL
jgi:hypothetical protein